MTSSTVRIDRSLTNPKILQDLPKERRLPSGRSVVVRIKEGTEELEIRSPHGEVELRVTLSDSGPVASLRGGRLELESAETIAVRCSRFELQTSEGTELTSSGDVQISGREFKVRTEKDIHMNGEVIRLNC